MPPATTCARSLVSVGGLRHGSLAEAYRKCGRPNCHCARKVQRGDGPYGPPARSANGKALLSCILSGRYEDLLRWRCEDRHAIAA